MLAINLKRVYLVNLSSQLVASFYKPLNQGQILKTYLAVKQIKAKPMTLGEYNNYRKWDIPKQEDPFREGYLVEYPDGYQSWSPKEIFDASHLEIQNATTISPEDLDLFIGPNALGSMKLGDKTTMVEMNPRTGFVMYETSSCVDPANYDHEMGCNICVEKLKDRLWPMLGFVLQWAVNGLAPLPEHVLDASETDSSLQ